MGLMAKDGKGVPPLLRPSGMLWDVLPHLPSKIILQGKNKKKLETERTAKLVKVKKTGRVATLT